MTSQRFDESSDLPAARPDGGVPGARSDGLRAWAQELVARSRQEGVKLTGDGGLLTHMVQEVLQAGLDVELTEILVTGRTTRLAMGRATRGMGATRRRSRRMSGRSSCRCPAIGKEALSRRPSRSTPGAWKGSVRT